MRSGVTQANHDEENKACWGNRKHRRFTCAGKDRAGFCMCQLQGCEPLQCLGQERETDRHSHECNRPLRRSTSDSVYLGSFCQPCCHHWFCATLGTTLRHTLRTKSNGPNRRGSSLMGNRSPYTLLYMCMAPTWTNRKKHIVPTGRRNM